MAENYLGNYLPEYEDEAKRTQYRAYPLEELVELLIRKEKEARVVAKLSDELQGKLDRIREILDEPSMLAAMNKPIRWD